MAIFLILPHLYFFCVVVYRIANWIYGRRCCRGQDAGEQQSLLNVAIAAMNSFVARIKHRCIRHTNSSDGDTDDCDCFKRNELLDTVHYSSRDSSVHIPNIDFEVSETELIFSYHAFCEGRDEVSTGIQVSKI